MSWVILHDYNFTLWQPDTQPPHIPYSILFIVKINNSAFFVGTLLNLFQVFFFFFTNVQNVPHHMTKQKVGLVHVFMCTKYCDKLICICLHIIKKTSNKSHDQEINTRFFLVRLNIFLRKNIFSFSVLLFVFFNFTSFFILIILIFILFCCAVAIIRKIIKMLN